MDLEARRKNLERARLRDKVRELVLSAALKELHWDVGDRRHDPEQWKTELRQKLEELGVDFPIYT